MGGGKRDSSLASRGLSSALYALTSTVLQMKRCPAPLLKSKPEACDALSPDTVIQILLPVQHLCPRPQQGTHMCLQLH